MRSIYDPMTKTPAQWREQAQECRQRSHTSWENSDTDGFLSQRANDIMSRRYEQLAQLAEQGGMADFACVLDLDGNEVKAREYEGRYGWSWRIVLASGQVVWFNESQARKGARRLATDRKKGFQMGTYRAEAVMVDGQLEPKYDGRREVAVVSSQYGEDY